MFANDVKVVDLFFLKSPVNPCFKNLGEGDVWDRNIVNMDKVASPRTPYIYYFGGVTTYIISHLQKRYINQSHFLCSFVGSRMCAWIRVNLWIDLWAPRPLDHPMVNSCRNQKLRLRHTSCPLEAKDWVLIREGMVLGTVSFKLTADFNLSFGSSVSAQTWL